MADLDRIMTDPQILGGKPCIRGMRISVERVLDIAATYGNDWIQIKKDFPDLEPEDVQQSLWFASRYVPDGDAMLKAAS